MGQLAPGTSPATQARLQWREFTLSGKGYAVRHGSRSPGLEGAAQTTGAARRTGMGAGGDCGDARPRQG